MTDTQFQEILQYALLEAGVPSARTFDDAGVLTMNKGLVVRTTDGTEFQVTIVRSR